MHENGIRATRKVDPTVQNLWLLEPYGNETKIGNCNEANMYRNQVSHSGYICLNYDVFPIGHVY